uniref:Beta-hexosaminidase n=2 Tax=Hirondellea gigas TaxID=1518452 RepID=A0A6A7G573_9CRUS
MKLIVTWCVAVLLLAAGAAAYVEMGLESPWTFNCEGTGDDARCVKKEAEPDLPVQTLNQCKLICGSYGPLWPRPSASVTLGSGLQQFTVAKMTDLIVVPEEVGGLMRESMAIFRNHLDMYHPDYNWIEGTAPWTVPTDPSIADHNLYIQISVTEEVDRLSLSTDESYSLDIVPAPGITTVVIVAQTFFGARHGLESLSQVMNYNEENDCLQIIDSVVIDKDNPAFPYRGLAIDTSRNYIPVKDIERTLDAMSSTKLNTFHWHITDSHSFPVMINSLPKMHQYGAYSSRELYHPDEVRGLVEYGRVRGIRVMPEIDAPAHVGNGWQWGPQEGLGDLAVCVNQEPWASYCVEPPCGQLNLANENMYDVLLKVYQEITHMFQPVDLIHFGGDEVNLNCWNTTDEIVEWMQTVGDGTLSEGHYMQEWSNFQNRAFDLFTDANNGTQATGIIWTSTLTEQGGVDSFLDKDKYIIQIWSAGNDTIIKELLENEFRVIFSNYDAWYFDCGFGAWVGEGNNWCSPYIGWQKVYDNSPHEMAGSQDYYDQVIGGEAAMWSEQVDQVGLDAKLWPRGAALGERLWSNPSSSWEAAEVRMVHHRQRMVQRGVAAERLQPKWCFQNEGLCYA